MLFRRIVLYALLIGALSGLLLSAIQFWQIIPIIQTAERYEEELAAVQILELGQAVAGHTHDVAVAEADEWAPDEGAERTGFTLLWNMMTAAGFAMLLITAIIISLGENDSTRLSWKHGILWSAAGYAVFFLAPAIGLPPEIPGAVGAPVEAKLIWWLFVVVFTAAGLAGLAFARSPWRWVALALPAVPHLVGSPHVATAMFPGHPPAAVVELEQLAQQFIFATAFANAMLWLVLGMASVWAVKVKILSASSVEPSSGELSPSE